MSKELFCKKCDKHIAELPDDAVENPKGTPCCFCGTKLTLRPLDRQALKAIHQGSTVDPNPKKLKSHWGPNYEVIFD